MGLCDKCSLELATFLDCPNQVEVTLCPVCGAHFVQGRWRPYEGDEEDLVYEAAEKAVGIHKELEMPKVALGLEKRKANQYYVNVEVAGLFRGLPAKEECNITVSIKKNTCNRCSRMAGNYYEATVQVRSWDKKLAPKELDQCKVIASIQTKKSLEKGDRLSFIQEMKDVKGGVDVVVGSAQQGRTIAKAIQEEFGGNTQESYKLVGRREGKDVYRTTILVRLPKLNAGDVVRSEGVLLEIIGFEGKNTITVVVEDGKRRSLSEEIAQKAQLLGNRTEAQKSMVVAEDRDVVEILDPESFKIVSLSKPRQMEDVLGREVDVLRSREGMIILPSL